MYPLTGGAGPLVHNYMLVDQDTNFGKLFIHVASLSNVQVDMSGVEAHNSLSLGERYHQPLK